MYRGFQPDSTTTFEEAVCYAVGVVLACMLFAIVTQKAELENELIGMKIRFARVRVWVFVCAGVSFHPA